MPCCQASLSLHPAWKTNLQLKKMDSHSSPSLRLSLSKDALICLTGINQQSCPSLEASLFLL
uniref:Uncharacterized protein n=1 Tax=uncultured Nitrospirae bacterium MY2-1F TaxID=798576 RepID=D9MNX5_9BACT|nr:hypothetical protein LW1_0120 [uncultured Nitrospirae bacterium MY2-1F]